MTRKAWTTDSQEEWLKDRIEPFLKAHQDKTLSKEFFPLIVKEFREQWPVPPLTSEETAAGPTVEQAMKNKRSKYDQRTRSWFHNHTRSQTSAANGILKIKQKPKIMQPWQAYQALTYESRWKEEVDIQWGDYVAKWKTENPDEKPEKTRLVYLMEFMKEKLEAESDAVKKTVEDFRLSKKDESPAPGDWEHDTQIQSAIEKIPRTLATIGDSILQQTGWHVTVLCGGPAPDANGQILSYLAHYGKTKDGLNFEKFLGPKEYDEHLLVPFEKFLNNCFMKENSNIEDRETDEDEVAEEKIKKIVTKDSVTQDREANIASSKAKTRISDHFKPRAWVSNKKMDDGTGDKQSSSTLDPTPCAIAAPDGIANGSTLSNKATETAVAPTPPEPETESTPSSTARNPTLALATSTASRNNLPLIQPAASATTAETMPPGEEISANPTPPEILVITNAASVTTAEPMPRGDIEKQDVDVVMDSDTENPESNSSPVSDPCLPQNDDNLPPWLTHNIEYLRNVSKENEWQNLVTEFITFEKSGPPTGNLPTKSRPGEIPNWIKSKNKDYVPSVIPSSYGPSLMKWWRVLQPSWRDQGEDNLSRNMAKRENWSLLKKGGKAGIYTVVMGLSWWIKAQGMQRDADIWFIVNDLTWVLHQMYGTGSGNPVLAKRARDDEDRDEGIQKRVTRSRRS